MVHSWTGTIPPLRTFHKPAPQFLATPPQPQTPPKLASLIRGWLLWAPRRPRQAPRSTLMGSRMLEFTAALRRGAMMTVAVLSMVIGLAVAAVLLVRGETAAGAWLLPAP